MGEKKGERESETVQVCVARESSMHNGIFSQRWLADQLSSDEPRLGNRVMHLGRRFGKNKHETGEGFHWNIVWHTFVDTFETRHPSMATLQFREIEEALLPRFLSFQRQG